MTEDWRSIPGFPMYLISCQGNVKSLFSNKLLKFDEAGRKRYRYPAVRLFNGTGKPYHAVVHKLVWIAFNGLVPDGYHIDHIDRDRKNAKLNNLRCVTNEENQANKAEKVVPIITTLEEDMEINI